MRVFLLLFLVMISAAPAFGFGKGMEGCSGDCTACHKVSLAEVKEIFRTLDPTISVEDVTPAPARSLYQVTLKKEGQLQIAYLDYSKNFLLAGRLLDIRGHRDLTQKSLDEATILDPSRIPLDNTLVMGNPAGKKVLYVFSDPECPYCSVLHKTLTELVQEEPELKVYLILVPLDIHPDALWKTESIICESKKDMASALAMLGSSYEHKDVPRLDCAKGKGGEMKKLGEALGIAVTPTISFQSGKTLQGARSKEEIRKLLGP